MYNNIILFILAVCLIGFTFLFTNCKTGVQTMIDDYNSQFTPTEDEVLPPCPGDDNFHENKMLAPIYYICCDGTINLAAPYKCSSYEWKLFSPDKQLIEDIKKREFIYYLPTSHFDITAGTYQIKLEVKDSGGRSYNDTATIVIYDRPV